MRRSAAQCRALASGVLSSGLRSGVRAEGARCEAAPRARSSRQSPLSAIGLLDEHAELVKLIRGAIRARPDGSPVRFSKNVIDGHFIEDALVYSVT